MEIQWKTVKDCDNYEVSNMGQIRNKKGQLMKPADNGRGYLRCVLRQNNKAKDVYVHRVVAQVFVTATSEDQNEVDHIDKDKSNNCASNLRWATRSQNNSNISELRQNKPSKYKGVTLLKNKRWRARIVKDKKEYHLGSYEHETDAAKAYNAKSVELFGEFACVNIIKE